MPIKDPDPYQADVDPHHCQIILNLSRCEPWWVAIMITDPVNFGQDLNILCGHVNGIHQRLGDNIHTCLKRRFQNIMGQ